MKKTFCLILILACLTACLGGCSSKTSDADTSPDAATSADPEKSIKMMKDGDLTVTQLREESEPTGDMKIVAKDFSISEKQFEALKEEYLLDGEDKSSVETVALTQLIVKRAFYWYALNSGFVPDEDAIRSAADANNSAVIEANDADFQNFLKGANMSAEDYFTLQYSQYRMNYIISQYKSQLYKQFLKDNIAKNQSDDAWYAYIVPIVKKAVEAENVTVNNGSWQFDEETVKTLSMLKPDSSSTSGT